MVALISYYVSIQKQTITYRFNINLFLNRIILTKIFIYLFFFTAEHPQTAVSEWMHRDGEWSAGGLKIQVNEHMQSMRIIYNGILKCIQKNETQHAKFNFL